MTEPRTYLPIVEKVVKRYACPYCSRSTATKKATQNHIQRCWYAPENKACKTCWYGPEPGYSQCERASDTDYGSYCSCHHEGRECIYKCGLNIDITQMQTNCPEWRPDDGQ